MGLSVTPITPASANTPSYPPQSGTTVQAADVEASAQASANRDLYLENREGLYVVKYLARKFRDDATGSQYYSNNTTGWTSTGIGANQDIAAVVDGDVLEVNVTGFGVANNAGTSSAMFRLAYQDNAAAWVGIPGALISVATDTGVPFSLTTLLPFSAATFAALPVVVRVEGRVFAADGTSALLLGSYTYTVKHFRLLP